MVVSLMTLAASAASAQERGSEPFMPAVLKAVVLDPTTYSPAVMAWAATRLDWQSSQVLFRNGFVEHNAAFTVSGLPDDTAISYGAGNRQILLDAFANLQRSVANNVLERVTERLLVPRYPNHRKLLRAIGWIERSAVASYWSYQLSAGHVRQWQENERRAQQLRYQ